MTPGSIAIRANGRRFDLPVGCTVADFIRSRDLDPGFVIVERNGEPLERSRYESTALHDADRLELVRAVAGGSR